MEHKDVLQITSSQMQGRVPVTVFHLDGRMNMGTTESLEQEGKVAIAAGARNVLLDLTNVVSVTSAGLRTLYWFVQSMETVSADGQAGTAPRSGKEKSPHVKLLNPSPAIQNVLAIAGFNDFLEIHDDLQTAVSSFG